MDILNSAIKLLVKDVLNRASLKVAKRFEISSDEAIEIWKDLYNELEENPNISMTSLKSLKDHSSKRVKKVECKKVECKKVECKKIKKVRKSCEDVTDISQFPEESEVPQESKDSKDSEDSEESDGNSDDESPCCVHVLTRGPKKDEECGKRVSAKSQTGHYCSVHLNQENKVKPVKPPKSTNNTKSTVVNKKINKLKNEQDNEEIKIKIMKDPDYGRYVHIGTGLVFKSVTEKIVVGRQDEHGQVHLLTSDDVSKCLKFRFPFDKKCVDERVVDERVVDERVVDERVVDERDAN
jgi:hypothetical protein